MEFKKLMTPSLTDLFIQELQRMILSEELKIGCDPLRGAADLISGISARADGSIYADYLTTIFLTKLPCRMI